MPVLTICGYSQAEPTRAHTQIEMQTGDATQLDTVDKVGGPINWILSQQTTIG